MLCLKNNAEECCGCMKCRGYINDAERVVFKCSLCGADIYDGEPFWQPNEEQRLCEQCIDAAKQTARYERKSFVKFTY